MKERDNQDNNIILKTQAHYSFDITELLRPHLINFEKIIQKYFSGTPVIRCTIKIVMP